MKKILFGIISLVYVLPGCLAVLVHTDVIKASPYELAHNEIAGPEPLTLYTEVNAAAMPDSVFGDLLVKY